MFFREVVAELAAVVRRTVWDQFDELAVAEYTERGTRHARAVLVVGHFGTTSALCTACHLRRAPTDGSHSDSAPHSHFARPSPAVLT